jgi:hypothetical protein
MTIGLPSLISMTQTCDSTLQAVTFLLSHFPPTWICKRQMCILEFISNVMQMIYAELIVCTRVHQIFPAFLLLRGVGGRRWNISALAKSISESTDGDKVQKGVVALPFKAIPGTHAWNSSMLTAPKNWGEDTWSLATMTVGHPFIQIPGRTQAT